MWETTLAAMTQALAAFAEKVIFLFFFFFLKKKKAIRRKERGKETNK